MNNLRAAILSGEALRPSSPVASKRRREKTGEPGSITGIAIRREESRHVDQRRQERQLAQEQHAILIIRGERLEATVVNISPGGMMIECGPIELLIGEPVDIELADCNATTCLVRWVREPRVGLEFSEETTIIGSRSVQDFIIRSLRGQLEEVDAGAEPALVNAKRAVRHRLTWLGSIHFQGESTLARLRNISADGAMVECDWDFHLGTELLLDLEAAGTIVATVRWCRGGQLGLKFATRFDMRSLARATEVPIEKPREPTAAPGYTIDSGAATDRKPVGKLSLSQVADIYGRAATSR